MYRAAGGMLPPKAEDLLASLDADSAHHALDLHVVKQRHVELTTGA